MKKKTILIGSIGATVLLVLVSFTSVVGFQTMKSYSGKNHSPLFDVRIGRAIKEVTNNVAMSNYIGKEKPFTLHLLPSINNRLQLEKIIDIMSKMTQKEFNRFVILVITQALEKKIVNKEQIPAVRTLLNHLRYNPGSPELLGALPYLGEKSDFTPQIDNYLPATSDCAPATALPLLCLAVYALIFLLLLVLIPMLIAGWFAGLIQQFFERHPVLSMLIGCTEDSPCTFVANCET